MDVDQPKSFDSVKSSASSSFSLKLNQKRKASSLQESWHDFLNLEELEEKQPTQKA